MIVQLIVHAWTCTFCVLVIVISLHHADSSLIGISLVRCNFVICHCSPLPSYSVSVAIYAPKVRKVHLAAKDYEIWWSQWNLGKTECLQWEQGDLASSWAIALCCWGPKFNQRIHVYFSSIPPCMFCLSSTGLKWIEFSGSSDYCSQNHPVNLSWSPVSQDLWPPI